MTQEEKARAYDEALAKAREYKKYDYMMINAALDNIFPELAESEDEKVKRILHSISSKMSANICDIFTEEEFQCFDAWSNSWLEKQGKPKWSEEDEAHLHSITMHLKQWIERHPNTCGADIQGENLAWLKSLKQRE